MSDTPSGAAPDLTSDERIIRLLNRIREHLAAYVEGHAEDTSSWQNQRFWFDVDLSTKVLAMSVRRMGPKIVVLMEAQVPDSSYFVQHRLVHAIPEEAVAYLRTAGLEQDLLGHAHQLDESVADKIGEYPFVGA